MGRDDEDRIQRALNEAKKRELEEKFGGTFHTTDPSLPPLVEAEWIRSIEEFEQKFAAAGQTTVRRFLGNPPIVPLAGVPPEDLQSMLKDLVTRLKAHNIVVGFNPSVSDREAYRFITEELLDQEVDDIRIEGMTQCFLYEEFHPDDRHEATLQAGLFLRCMLAGNEVLLENTLAVEGTAGPDGDPIRREALREQIAGFRTGIATVLSSSVEESECVVDGSLAGVTARLCWEGLRPLTMEPVRGTALSTVTLRKEESGFWGVVGFQWHPVQDAS